MILSEAEALDAIRAAVSMPDCDQGALTTAELCDLFGLGRDAVLARVVHPLVRAGRLRVVRKHITDIASRPGRVPAYQVVP